MSALSDRFEFQLKAVNLPDWEAEYLFHPERKWRFDYAFVKQKVAVEIEGGVWSKGGGRHNRGSGFVADLVKYNAAAELGWRVFRYAVNHVDSGAAIAQVERVLK